MDQVIQLQQQVQRLQQEINDITQVCNQLQQSEQTNAMQLQQLTQKELLASQGLRRIQQVAGQLSQDISQITNITQQIATQVPMQRTMQSTGVFPGSYNSYTGLSNQIPGTGVFSSQMGSFGQSQVPNINMSPVVSQFPLHTQGYSANLFGTGSQLGTTSQAFNNASTNQLGIGTQGALASSLYSPMQNASMAMTSPWSSMQSGLGSAANSYSPYQANQFGFR